MDLLHWKKDFDREIKSILKDFLNLGILSVSITPIEQKRWFKVSATLEFSVMLLLFPSKRMVDCVPLVRLILNICVSTFFPYNFFFHRIISCSSSFVLVWPFFVFFFVLQAFIYLFPVLFISGTFTLFNSFNSERLC